MKTFLTAIAIIFLTWGFFVWICAQNKAEFNLRFEGQKWHSFVIDSAYLGVNDTILSLIGINQFGQERYGYGLPKRADGTYKYWKQIKGKLQPVIKYRNSGRFKAEKYTVME